MGEFWGMMTPFLIAAVVVPVCLGLPLMMIPTDEWAEQVIRGWAESEGMRVAAIDDSRWYDRLLAKIHKVDRIRMSNGKSYRVYRIRVVDKKGCKRECKVVVGRFLLFPTFPNIRITWIKAR